MSGAVGPGTTFAGYRIESLIGRGGMGVVYRAHRPVARAPGRAEADRARAGATTSASAAASSSEPRLAASLDHPNVVPIYEAGEHDGQLYLAMRYVEGSDLKTLLAARRHARARAGARDPRPGRRARSTPRTGAASSTATSSRPTSCSTSDEHAYLTDFGVTKQVGGDSTETGAAGRHARLPRPRADPRRAGRRPHRRVRARVRALRVPGRRAAVPARDARPRRCGRTCRRSRRRCRRHPALDPVLRTALAKERDDRYATLRRADRGGAGGARLRPGGAGAAPVSSARRRALPAAGLVVLARDRGAAIVTLRTGARPRRRQAPDRQRRRGDRPVALAGYASFIEAGGHAEQPRRRRGRGLGAEHRRRDT